ncbi:MAG TPA: Fe-S cluster assembly protein SufD [Stellaceae bacterium]|nr:Fe-S cluster assembly protein SufD [Stellaceae bacterium]
MSAVLDFPVKPAVRPYLDAFAENAGEPQWLREWRRRSLNRFAELGFPSRRSENWRYLDLQPLERAPLLPRRCPPAGGAAALPADASLGIPAHRLVLIDACISPEFSGEAEPAMPGGARLGSLAAALAEERETVRAAIAEGGLAGPLAALAAASFTDGFVLDLAPGTAVEQPIEIVHAASGAPASLHTSSLINLGAGSRATIVETYAGAGARYWRNDVVSARLGHEAQLTRIVVVEEGEAAIHTALFDARLEKGARLDGFVLLLGGSRARQEWTVRLAGEGAQCRLDGAFVVGGADEANIVTAVDHAAPGGETRELIKGVAAGRGHGAFQGRIIVREHAQKTDAHQLSRNLILGRRAVIDTKPELEIFADDVKCSHGASVGDLDEAALFYLKSRGIPPDAARHMLIEGFLREAAGGVADVALRDYLLRRLAARLGRLEE